MKNNRIAIKRKKITYQKDYTLPNGEVVKVNIKSDVKNCNKCLNKQVKLMLFSLGTQGNIVNSKAENYNK